MNVAYLTGSVSRLGGGLFESMRYTGQALHTCGVDVRVIGLRDQFTDDDLIQWAPLVPQAAKRLPPHSFGFASGLSKIIHNSSPDIVHVQGVWMYPSLLNSQLSKRFKWPYLISPHGMLDPWALANSRWKKRLVAWRFEKRHLQRATCLHALCDSERQSMREFGLTNDICVIPNGVELDDRLLDGEPVWSGSIPADKKVMLFLGRLHPKKGLRELILAWARLRQRSAHLVDDWALAIAGWDQSGHAQELQRLIDELGLRNDVFLVGAVFGDAKLIALRSATAFILPSKSEGLPMAILEAWAQRLPVAMTAACNLPEGVDAQAAFEIKLLDDSNIEGLEHFLTLPDSSLKAMGDRGRKLVEDRFTWATVAHQLRETYDWALNGGPTPASVEMAP
ncbi:glycosyltransferase [Planctomicrobium sp. SH527]|uniref:glycosyltransferase n=1 Tax=Planctomicrobium sp. SH527 TaxID=3448123 RepID=UPI003F5C85B4